MPNQREQREIEEELRHRAAILNKKRRGTDIMWPVRLVTRSIYEWARSHAAARSKKTKVHITGEFEIWDDTAAESIVLNEQELALSKERGKLTKIRLTVINHRRKRKGRK